MGGTDLSGNLNPFQMKRGPTCYLSILPIVPQNGQTFLPLECLDVVGLAVKRVGLQNFVEDEACLEEGNCF